MVDAKQTELAQATETESDITEHIEPGEDHDPFAELPEGFG